MRDRRPVRVRAGAEPEPLDRSPPRSTTQLVAPRGLSTRPMPSRAPPPRRSAAAGPIGPSSRRVEQRRTTASSSSARCSSRAWTSPAARSGRDRLEAVVGEPGLVARASSASAGGAGGRADRAERARVVGGDDADVGQPVLERGVEEQLAPAALRVVADAPRAPRVRPRRRSRRASSSLPPTRTLPKRKRWPVSARVQPAGALGQRGEPVVAGGEPARRRRRRRCRSGGSTRARARAGSSARGRAPASARGRAPPRRRARRRPRS